MKLKDRLIEYWGESENMFTNMFTNIFTNEVKILKKENDRIARWLEEEDEDIIDKIMDSLGIFRVNSFDAQIIRRDLI